ncbi:PAS domain S-box protein [Ammoniphilus sp. YIM 78166]|uniref:PAS domain S-box protein n=1 Tax=Ammoniphilus sp. YIM 78166 TaxID=1644106 RepID=UPI00106F10C3|nr:PAS domain S-box protein [Ammoniphilus sp. YIM 78166]
MELLGVYNVPLMILSFLVAVVASYTALDLIGRLTVSSGYVRKILLIGGACAIGMGVWSMHFIAMLSYHLPIGMEYSLWHVLASLGVSILFAFAALRSIPRIILGSLFMGSGISMMHYMGMAAIKGEVTLGYSFPLVLLSILIAILASYCAFWLSLYFRSSEGRFQIGKLGSSLIMGLAICGMHYTGMAATRIFSNQPMNHERLAFSYNDYLLAASIGIAALLILGFALITMFIDRRLSESEKHHYSLFEQNPDMVVLLDKEGRILAGNAKVQQVTGYSPKEFKGQHSIQFLFSSDIQRGQTIFQRSLQGEAIEDELKIQHKYGFYIDLQIKTIPMVIETEFKGVYVIARDITELVQSRKELKLLSHKHKLILNSVADGVFGVDKEGCVIFWNPAAEKITGYAVEEVIGKPFELLASLTEDVFCKKDGNRFPVEYTSAPILDQGAVIGSVITFSDITEKKQTEELIRTSEKLSVAGQLAAGIAHEIRNPLTAIKGFLKLLETDLHDKRHYVDIMHSEMQRMELILSELLVLAKPQEVTSEVEDLQELLNHVTALLSTQGNLHNIIIHVDYGEDIPHIVCDKNQLKQVFINIIKNSMEAMPKGGEIRIEVRRVKQMVNLRFIDEGCGIPEDQLQKIGQPFFTTKEKGTGLGFMISKRIIEEHGGTLSISSKLNEGTTMEISLPVSTSVK